MVAFGYLDLDLNLDFKSIELKCLDFKSINFKISYLWETLMVLMVQDPNQASQQLETKPKMGHLKS
jgi:hypothetical protein